MATLTVIDTKIAITHFMQQYLSEATCNCMDLHCSSACYCIFNVHFR